MTNTNAFRTVLKNAFEAGNKKAIGVKPIEGALRTSYGKYCQSMLDLQAALHDHVSVQAMEDKDKAKAGKVESTRTAVYTILKGMIENVRGIVCESGDLLYLQLAAYKLAKSKDVENDDGSFIIGTKRLVPVSSTSFRLIVEALLGNKIAGNTWDVAMQDFRAQTDAEKERIQAKLDKRDASVKKKASKEKAKAEKGKAVTEKAKVAAEKEKPVPVKAAAKKEKATPANAEKKAVVAESKPAPVKKSTASRTASAKPSTKANAMPAAAPAVKPTTTVIGNPNERRLDGTLSVKASA